MSIGAAAVVPAFSIAFLTTRFEAISAALSYARTGIVGATMLGFGRALGETMAVKRALTRAAAVLSEPAPRRRKRRLAA